MPEEECNVPNEIKGGTFEVHPASVTGKKFDPTTIDGWKPNDGDTHGDTVLEVPDCP